MRLLVFVWMCLFCSASCFAQSPWLRNGPPLARLGGRPDPGNYNDGRPYAAQAAYRVLFKKIGADGVQALLTHKSDMIALRAAWEQVNLTVPKKDADTNPP